MKKKPTRVVAPAEHELPASFSREVGRIVVRWAYFENVIRKIAWNAMGVDDKIGRIAVRDPRIDDRIGMIGDIAFLRGIACDDSELKDLTTKANHVLKWRDLVAHGIWIPTPKGWLIQLTSGNYPKSYEYEHIKRRINPEGLNVTIEGLRSVADATLTLIDIAHNLRDQLASSQRTDRKP